MMVSLNIGSGANPKDGAVNIDIFPDTAEEHFRGKQVPPTLFCDAHTLPFDDDVFDKVYLIHSLEHMHTPLRVLRECCRVLKTGGVIVVELPNPYQRRRDQRNHLYSWSRSALRNILRASGFTVILPTDYTEIGNNHIMRGVKNG